MSYENQLTLADITLVSGGGADLADNSRFTTQLTNFQLPEVGKEIVRVAAGGKARMPKPGMFVDMEFSFTLHSVYAALLKPAGEIGIDLSTPLETFGGADKDVDWDLEGFLMPMRIGARDLTNSTPAPAPHVLALYRLKATFSGLATAVLEVDIPNEIYKYMGEDF